MRPSLGKPPSCNMQVIKMGAILVNRESRALAVPSFICASGWHSSLQAYNQVGLACCPGRTGSMPHCSPVVIAHVCLITCCVALVRHNDFVVNPGRAGTLQQAVLIESLCSTALAGPLIYVTRAWQTADVKLLVSISVFVVSRCQA